MQRSLIVLFACQVTWAYSYFITSAMIVQALTANLGLTDVQAGIVYSAYGTLISVYGTLTSFVIDSAGVFDCIGVGAFVGTVGRVAIAGLLARDAFATSQGDVALVVLMLSTLLPASDALVGQVCGLGVKRYTGPVVNSAAGFDSLHAKDADTDSRSTEYSMGYALQNVAAMLAFGTLAALNWLYPTSEALVNQWALYLAVPPMALTLILAYVGKRGDVFDVDLVAADRADALLAEADTMREEEDAMLRDENGARQLLTRVGRCTRCWVACAPLRVRRWLRTLGTSDNGILARYMIMALLLVPVKTLFKHMEATLPKYTQRMFDPNFSYALLLLINPLMCIVLAVPLGAALKRFNDYKVIVVGTSICCVAVALAMIPSVPALVIYIFIFSFGEIVWTPRLQSYFYALAPRGEEGAFGAMASVPPFLAKLPVGLLSGMLLDKTCPAYGTCDSGALWGIIGATALVSPVTLAIAYCWIARGITAHMAAVHADDEDYSYDDPPPDDDGKYTNTSNGNTHNVRPTMETQMLTPRHGMLSREKN